MKSKTFKSKFSDVRVEVYESGFIVIFQHDIEPTTSGLADIIGLGKPENARIELVEKAIKYARENGITKR